MLQGGGGVPADTKFGLTNPGIGVITVNASFLRNKRDMAALEHSAVLNIPELSTRIPAPRRLKCIDEGTHAYAYAGRVTWVTLLST